MTAVALVDEEEEEEIEEEEEFEEEEEDTEDIEPAKAKRKLFWIGLISLIIGSQIVALGSFVHNKLDGSQKYTWRHILTPMETP